MLRSKPETHLKRYINTKITMTTGMLHIFTKVTVATAIAIKRIRLNVGLFKLEGAPL